MPGIRAFTARAGNKVALRIAGPSSPERAGARLERLWKGRNLVIFRDGSSLGYAGVMVDDPKRASASSCSQTRSETSGDRAAFAPAGFPFKPANTKHIESQLDSKVLDSYLGRYEAKGEGIFTIARENDFLTIESPADGVFRNSGSVRKVTGISLPPSFPFE